MHTLFVIIGIYLGMFAVAFLLTGVISLSTPSDEEIEAVQQAYERERAKGFWHEMLYAWGAHRRAKQKVLSNMASHWKDRPESIRLVIIGACCAVAGLIIAVLL